MVPYLKEKREKEGKEKAEEAGDVVESRYDIDFLRDSGLEEVADKLEAQTQVANQPDGEESPQEQPEERQEDDLTDEVDLPSSQDDEDDAADEAPPPPPPVAPPAPSAAAARLRLPPKNPRVERGRRNEGIP